MNATTLYVSTCRYILQADFENSETWADLYRLLPYLRQSLSCCVCAALLMDPQGPTDSNCQHFVCRTCLGKKMILKPSCGWCKDYGKFDEAPQLKILLSCYKKLCEYIAATPIARSFVGANGESNTTQTILQEGMAINASHGSNTNNHGKTIDVLDILTKLNLSKVRGSGQRQRGVSTNVKPAAQAASGSDVPVRRGPGRPRRVQPDGDVKAGARASPLSPGPSSVSSPPPPQPQTPPAPCSEHLPASCSESPPAPCSERPPVPYSEPEENAKVVGASGDSNSKLNHNGLCNGISNGALSDHLDASDDHSFYSSSLSNSDSTGTKRKKKRHRSSERKKNKKKKKKKEKEKERKLSKMLKAGEDLDIKKLLMKKKHRHKLLKRMKAKHAQKLNSDTLMKLDGVGLEKHVNGIGNESLRHSHSERENVFETPKKKTLVVSGHRALLMKAGRMLPTISVCRCGTWNRYPGANTCRGNRCPCFMSERGCLKCKCRGCRNPFDPPKREQNQKQTLTIEINGITEPEADLDQAPDSDNDPEVTLNIVKDTSSF